MWPFTSKYTLEESGLFHGFTDFHCHLLPGVDDGVKELEETLAILSLYERLGVAKVWLTPHVMEDVDNEPDKLREVFEKVKQAYSGNIEICLASENMLDNLFDVRIAYNRVLPIGVNADHLLVETSYFTPPYDFDNKLEVVKNTGYYPILAHPERYVYMDDKDYDQLLAKDIRLQLNIYSIIGMYGPEAKQKAQKLLKRGAYAYIGTDTHRLRQLEFAIKQKVLKKKEIEDIQAIIDRTRAK